MVTRVQQALQSAAGAAGGGGNYNVDVTTIGNIDTELNGGMTFQPTNTSANWLGFWIDPRDGKTFYVIQYGQNKFQKWTSSASGDFPTTNWTCSNVSGSQIHPSVSATSSLGNLGHMQFWDGGSRFMMTSIDGGDVYGFSLSTDYTLNTNGTGITTDWSDTSFGSKVGASAGMGWVCMSEDGTRALAKGYQDTANIYRSNTLTNGNITASGVTWTDTGVQTTFSLGGATVSPDGRFLYDMEYNGGTLVKIDAGDGNTLWDSATSGWTKTSSGANALDKPAPGYGNGTIQFDWDNKAGVADHADGTPQIRAFVTYMNSVDAVVYGNVKLVT